MVIESSLVNAGRRGFLGIFGRRQATWEDRWEDTTRTLDPSGGGELVNEQAVGDFVTNFSFNPYMRARDVNIYVSGLRPNTQHYFFFDEQVRENY